MKWDTMPLWPIVIPLSVGFFMACIFGVIENSSSLLKPAICLLIMPFVIWASPIEIGNPKEFFGGYIVSLIFGILPQLIFFVWFIIVILIWVSQTTYLWRHDSPVFRIGIWIGLGSCTGLFLGSFLCSLFSYYSYLKHNL